MSNLPSLLHDGAMTAAMASLLYTGTVTVAAFTALMARTPGRRRAARDVLKILLRRRDPPR
jgi:hypothetical protein